jgi:hypothetical protein
MCGHEPPFWFSQYYKADRFSDLLEVRWAMKVRFLYSEDCPSHQEALQRLRHILQEEGVETNIEVVRVETFEEAEREHFQGSPTIMIEGQDICPTENPRYAPACRAYVLEDGRISPLPSAAMIRVAIRNAKKNLKDASESPRSGV